jgi:hypothetical protein
LTASLVQQSDLPHGETVCEIVVGFRQYLAGITTEGRVAWKLPAEGVDSVTVDPLPDGIILVVYEPNLPGVRSAGLRYDVRHRDTGQLIWSRHGQDEWAYLWAGTVIVPQPSTDTFRCIDWRTGGDSIHVDVSLGDQGSDCWRSAGKRLLAIQPETDDLITILKRGRPPRHLRHAGRVVVITDRGMLVTSTDNSILGWQI